MSRAPLGIRYHWLSTDIATVATEVLDKAGMNLPQVPKDEGEASRCIPLGPYANLTVASLPAHLAVWLASKEAHFLNGKYVWAHWDVEEMKARADEIKNSPMLTTNTVGWPFGFGEQLLEL